MDDNITNFHIAGNEDLQAKHGFLKSQVSPHILFNTLSFIKYAVKHEPHKAKDALSNLAELLSCGLSQVMTETVLLSDQVGQMENMFSLQKMRFDGRQNISFLVDQGLKGIRIMPLVLVSLLENIFRHGNVLRKDAATQIELKK